MSKNMCENNMCELNNSKKVIKKKRSKKIITIIALVAALGLTGAGIKKHIDSKPTYTINEETKKNELDGTITFDQLNKYSLITLIDLNGEEKYVIGKQKLSGLKDLSNGEVYSVNAYNTNEVYIVKEEPIINYLITLDYVQQLYDASDIENINEQIAEYKANNASKEKTLSK